MRLPFWTRAEPPRLRPARGEDAAQLAAIHAEGFAHPWSTLALEAMIAERGMAGHVVAGDRPLGFILARCAADEAEILTVAVARAARGQGHGARLLAASLDALVRRRIRRVFLEVEGGNEAALRLYRAAGFERIGERRGYYRQADGSRRDAVTMRLDLADRPMPAPDA